MGHQEFHDPTSKIKVLGEMGDTFGFVSPVEEPVLGVGRVGKVGVAAGASELASPP